MAKLTISWLYVVTRGMPVMVSLSLARKLSFCVNEIIFLISVKTLYLL